MMKLDQEEKEIVEAFESGKLKRVAGVKAEMKRHRQSAAATLKKDARINIRISSRNLRLIQKLALSEGLPYQTLFSSALHKFAEGRLISAAGRVVTRR